MYFLSTYFVIREDLFERRDMVRCELVGEGERDMVRCELVGEGELDMVRCELVGEDVAYSINMDIPVDLSDTDKDVSFSSSELDEKQNILPLEKFINRFL